MVGQPPDYQQYVAHLLGYTTGQGQPRETGRIDTGGGVEPPNHWLSQTVQLRNNQRSIEGTIPSFMCRDVGVDRQDPPEVTVYFDPQSKLVIYDIADRFSEVDR